VGSRFYTTLPIDGSLPDTGERRAIATRCGLKRQEIENIFDQLEALGWVIRTPGPLWSKPPHSQVNPEVHRRFAERATQEAIERERNREMLQEMFGTQMKRDDQ
jgi:DNA-binding transcriptional MocR family regulator